MLAMSKDAEIWESYKRGVSKAPKKKAPPPLLAGVGRGSAAKESAESHPTKLPPVNAQHAVPAQGALERKREKALRQGDISIDAKLDLHGMTQVEAYEALASFMQSKSKAGKRHLLIITGKGARGAGVLRNNLKNWLEQLPQAKNILALRPAAPHHGGDGAFYILMRKSR